MKYEDEIKGKSKQMKSAAKEKLGRFAGNRNLEEEGRSDANASKERSNKDSVRREEE